MIGKIILYVVLFSMLGIAGYFLYINILEMNAVPVSLVSNYEVNSSQPSYPEGNIQFYPNMRFAKKEISYSIDNLCSKEKRDRTMQALSTLEDAAGLAFYESSFPQITVSCQDTGEETGKYFIAGEGGPTSIINTTKFYVIETGKVLLFYNQNDCDNYNIELHELLHVFGFEHSSNSNSIMFNVSYCNQVLTNDIINELKRLYSYSSLPDLNFASASAIKQGSYLNFTIEVINAGLTNAKDISLDIYSENNKFYSYSLGDIDYGAGKMIWAVTKLPGRNTDNVRFVLSGIDLFNEDNIISFYLP